MTTSSLCSYCYCIEGKQKCVQPKCTLPQKEQRNCEPISIESSCCPIRYDCTDSKIIKAKYNAKYKRRRNENVNKHYLRMTSRMQRSRGMLYHSICSIHFLLLQKKLKKLFYSSRMFGEFQFLSGRSSITAKRGKSM